MRWWQRGRQILETEKRQMERRRVSRDKNRGKRRQWRGQKSQRRENERGGAGGGRGGRGGKVGGGWPILITASHQVIKYLDQHNCRFLWKLGTCRHRRYVLHAAWKFKVLRCKLQESIVLNESNGRKEWWWWWSRARLDWGQSCKLTVSSHYCRNRGKVCFLHHKQKRDWKRLFTSLKTRTICTSEHTSLLVHFQCFFCTNSQMYCSEFRGSSISSSLGVL